MNRSKLISYVFPHTIEEGRTRLGQKYEINLENGSKVLNSEHANYSFGSLHRIMLKGITEVLRHSKPARILMLGLGAGSALEILRKKCRWDYRVTAVELDADLISLARKHFDLEAHRNLDIINGDAALQVTGLPEASFDLIIDDVFWDNNIPEFCTGRDYLAQCKKLLVPGGTYMRNTMPGSGFDPAAYETLLASLFSEHYALTDKEYGNRIYFCKP